MKKLILLIVCLVSCMASSFATTISGSFNLCVGTTTTYFGTPTGGTWSSTNPLIASISPSSGVITANNPGTTMISYATPSGPGAVIVYVSATPPGPITGTFSTCAGSATVLSCTPSGGTWSSFSPSIATVSGGTVTGVAPGTAVISYVGPSSGCASTAIVTVIPCCSPSGPPPISTITSSVSSACPGTAITLNYVGLPISGATYQWQSSPDSLTWSNIAGATSLSHSFTGISATTYFRFVVTCPGSGLSSSTAGTKITWFSCCTGTPLGGTAMASTTYCSACSLTLSLSGATTGTYTTYQWESSVTGSGAWTSIPGATNDNYTYSPVGAAYYRCKVLCTSSSLSSYSSTVFVGYHYQITSDTATVPLSMCALNFSTVVNGAAGGLNLRTQYGDGTHDSVGLMAYGASMAGRTIVHYYSYTGTYSVKRVLYFNDMPQDSVSYTVYHQDCHVFPVEVFFDTDGDCVKGTYDPASLASIDIQVDSSGVTIDTLSLTSGLYYKAYGPPGTVYAFSFLPGALVATCPSSGVIYDTLNGSAMSYPAKYFAVNAGPVAGSDLRVNNVLSGTGRHAQAGHLYVSNLTCYLDSAAISFTYSPRYLAGISGSPTPATSSGNVVTWNRGALLALNPQVDIYYMVGLTGPISSWLLPGDTVHQRVSVTSVFGGDVDTSNNVIIRVDTVKSSWDPNYVEVSPAGCFDTDSSLHLQYTVHFENMGNDTAHNIYVLDTLSDYLDVKSLEIVMASHQMNVATYKIAGGHNVVKFDFPNIKLLDSSYHGLCDGAVIYTINSKSGIPVGESIKARAGIYFDINEVVMTNTSEKLKGCPPPLGVLGQSLSKCSLYPNPVNDELVVKADQNAFSSFTITNSIGQELIQKQLSGTQTRVNVKSLPAGIYYVVFAGAQGRETVKFVKE